MIKVFCDICGKDITNYKASRAIGKVGRLTVEIMTCVDGVWNGGNVCLECIKSACEISVIGTRNTAITAPAQGEKGNSDA